MKKIGVLTGGGDCPGLNAVLRGVVKTAINKYGYEVIGYKDGYKGLVRNNFVELKLEDVSGILDKGGTILGTSSDADPFSFKVEEADEIEYIDMSDEVVENLKIFDIDALICAGGDETMAIAEKLSKKGVNIVGLPKTIDNDIYGTTMSFGFMTAVSTATDAIDKLHATAEAHHRVMVLEVMGRKSGWIALESGIAGGADIIVIPEIPYDINKICEQIFKRKKIGKNFSIVVVAEGARPKGGQVTGQKHIEGGREVFKLGGIGNKIAEKIEEMTGIDTRVTVLGYLQRGGRPVTFDRVLSTRYAVEGVDLIHEEKYGNLVVVNNGKVSYIPLERAVSKTKRIDPDGEYVNIARSIGVSLGD